MQFYERALAGYNKYVNSQQKKDYFALAATLVLLIVLLIMVYPAVIHVSKVHKEVSDGNQLLTALRGKLSDLEQARQNYELIKEDLDLLDSALPIGSDVKTYIRTPLESLAAQHGLIIRNLQFNDVPISTPEREEELTLREFEFSANFDGSFVSFKEFLRELENYIRVTEVASFEIKRGSASQTIYMRARVNFLDLPINIVPNELETGGSGDQ